jgi:hypothetical protein
LENRKDAKNLNNLVLFKGQEHFERLNVTKDFHLNGMMENFIEDKIFAPYSIILILIVAPLRFSND